MLFTSTGLRAIHLSRLLVVDALASSQLCAWLHAGPVPRARDVDLLAASLLGVGWLEKVRFALAMESYPLSLTVQLRVVVQGRHCRLGRATQVVVYEGHSWQVPDVDSALG